MLHDLVGDRIVVVGEDLGVPLDRNKTLPDQFFLEDGCIDRVDDAARALFNPVAKRAHIASLINSFKHEWSVKTTTILDLVTPILTLPPTSHWAMESAGWLQ